jgi:hypothetical protein
LQPADAERFARLNEISCIRQRKIDVFKLCLTGI